MSLLLTSNNLLAGYVVEPDVPVRIGWQIPAATQGQLVQVLKRTNVLEAHGLKPSLVPFSYGGPQVEAAFAGELDVFFSGDQPAIDLIARSGKWKIVARLFDGRLAMIVPSGSPIQAASDLKGKVVASSFGSVPHREAFRVQKAVGLDPNKEVLNQNLDILEIGNRVQAGGKESWDGVDAAFVWEPILSSFALQGLARSIHPGRFVGVVAVSDDFIERHPQAVNQLLVALMRSWEFFSLDPDRVMDWFIQDTSLGYSRNALIAARVDANFSANSLSEISMKLTPDYIATLERASVWAQDTGVGVVNVSTAVDTGLLAAAIEQIEKKYEDIRVILPTLTESSTASKKSTFDLYHIPLIGIFAGMIF